MASLSLPGRSSSSLEALRCHWPRAAAVLNAVAQFGARLGNSYALRSVFVAGTQGRARCLLQGFVRAASS